MGLLTIVASPLERLFANSSTLTVVAASIASFLVLSVVVNVLNQILFRIPHEPPVVFHLFPVIGSTIQYGMDPYKFFFEQREKYGDVFTFVLLGKKTTVCLGTKGNDFILNAKHKDVNAEEIYRPLTAPVFGKGVVYDCPNSKLMEQKKFVKFGLTTEAFESYVPLIADETKNMITNSKWMQGDSGILDLPPAMAELTIYTASRTLQGPEVRSKMNAEFAEYFHDLDAGFQPINFMLPWAPLPQNRRRDAANKKMSDTYLEIIKDRRAGKGKDSQDMIWNLMQCEYKGNVPISDDEIAHMMIALLMAGQHSSSSTSTWILLRLAQNPEMIEELLAEQKRVLGSDLPALTYENIQKLPLNAQVVKETLRMHAPIHSVMRQVTNPLPVEGTPFVIPTSHTLLSAPGVTSKMSQYFPNPEVWDPHRWNADRTVTGNGDEDGDNADEKIDYGYGMVSKGGNSPYLPFGAGRHRCIGEQFAYLQLGTIIATMVRELRFENMGGKGDKSIVGTDYSSLFSQPLRPATVRWVRREDGKKSA